MLVIFLENDMKVFYFLIASLLFVNSAYAGAYKCNVNGKMTFSQTECADNAEAIKLDKETEGLRTERARLAKKDKETVLKAQYNKTLEHIASIKVLRVDAEKLSIGSGQAAALNANDMLMKRALTDLEKIKLEATEAGISLQGN